MKWRKHGTIKRYHYIYGNLTINCENETYDVIELLKSIKSIQSSIETLTNEINNRPPYGHSEKLWAGTLNRDQSTNISSGWSKYQLFMARTSDGVTMMLGFRYVDDNGKTENNQATIRFVGCCDDGTTSYLFKANVLINGNTLKLIQCSKHKIATEGITGEALALKSIHGII